MHQDQKGKEGASMKRIVKYVCAIAVTAFVVVMSAWLPPYLARETDSSFLNVVQKDESVSESYQYKATKYQKTKVLYELVGADFTGNMLNIERNYYETGVEQPAAETDPFDMSRFDNGVSSYNYPDISGGFIEEPAGDSVMTKAQAELAIVREARLLQETGAIPKFDLGKEGTYDAVDSIAFLWAVDPTVSNLKFYYWKGIISNPKTGQRYSLIIDDDLGKAYYMAISAKDDELGAWWDDLDKVLAAAEAFAEYHEFKVDYRKDFFTLTTDGPDYKSYIDSLFAMTDQDFDILTEIEDVSIFRMILKPSDIL